MTDAMFDVGADAYDRWVGRYGRELAQALIAEAAIAPGMRVLDVGCGPGALSRELAAVVGEENVTGVDPSESFVEACRARLPTADIRVAAAESLPFADATFDATVAQLVVNFMRDPEAGVGEMARVTRGGGRVAACVWDYGGEMTLIRAFFDSAIAVDPHAAERDEGRTMAYAREVELAELFRRLGLRDVRGGELRVGADYDGFADLIAPLASGVGPAGAYYASLDDAARARLAAELRGRLGVGDEPFRLTARAWYAVGIAAGADG